MQVKYYATTIIVDISLYVTKIGDFAVNFILWAICAFIGEALNLRNELGFVEIHFLRLLVAI